MRRISLVVLTVVACAVVAACASSTSPDAGRRLRANGDTTPYCSGVILPDGRCSEG